MTHPQPGEVWLVRPKGVLKPVATIRSREQEAWTALNAADGSLIVLPAAVPVRPVHDAPVPANATWDERVRLLAQLDRPYAGARP